MKLKDLLKVLCSQKRVVITVLGYFKESKKYYSFYTAFNEEGSETGVIDIKKLNPELLDFDVKSVNVYRTGEVGLWIDVIQWLDDFTGEEPYL